VIPRFFSDLAALFHRVEATDASGAAVPFADAVGRASALIKDQTAAGRKVIFIGNGGSAAIASHQAIDYWRNGGMRALAFNDPSLLTCISNDFGYPHVFEKPIEMFADAGDILVAISSSGQSANILQGAAAAQRLGCRVITLSGFTPGNPLRTMGKINFFVPSDSYGHVEIAHLCVCHCIVDSILLGT
jgi:D-sedoheptulose 7-phosphate isomerase